MKNFLTINFTKFTLNFASYDVFVWFYCEAAHSKSYGSFPCLPKMVKHGVTKRHFLKKNQK